MENLNSAKFQQLNAEEMNKVSAGAAKVTVTEVQTKISCLQVCPSDYTRCAVIQTYTVEKIAITTGFLFWKETTYADREDAHGTPGHKEIIFNECP